MPSSSNHRTLALLFLVALSVIASTLARPDPAQLVAMADAIKYLQDLDKFYAQVARPRYDFIKEHINLYVWHSNSAFSDFSFNNQHAKILITLCNMGSKILKIGG
jgi:hypothetical protein